MPFEDASSHLHDILDSIHSIQQFVRGMETGRPIAGTKRPRPPWSESCSSSARRLSG
jgi:hypothetical protein